MSMKIIIYVDGIYRTYQGDKDELYNQDWNERVMDMIDSALSEANKL